ncbi:methyl-accepting chemotaxis protein [Dactylosporangium sp. NPDC051541]|uniref:methyl-accepting chemotaxis protein n=1 Tax=Dactylosporangium sp. NPDC051541 TaxID=3363977 RepID=UPI0037B0C121
MSTATVPHRRSFGSAFRNVSVAWKLRTVAIVVCALLAGVGLIGLLYLGNSQDRLNSLYNRNLQSVQILDDVANDYLQVRFSVRGLALAQGDAEAAAAEQKITDAVSGLNESWKAYVGRDSDAAGKTDRAAFEAAWTDYQKILNGKSIPAARASNYVEYNRISREEVDPVAQRLTATLGSLVARQNTAAKGALEESKRDYDTARLLLLGLTLLAIVITFGMVTVVVRAVSRPLRNTVAVLTGLAQGRLDQRLPVDSRDEVGMMGTALNSALDRLSETVRTVVDSTHQLANASNQISGASQSLSQAATEQAASVEETTASMEQMTASISGNSDNATTTERIAAQAAGEAAQGGDAVQRTVDAMKQITSKISIIDDIAFQTNMLALNATIEAARAGEHGKGFAVVATEVGKLAERSQVAAQEISELAAGSVQTAERAGGLLSEIIPSITRTSDLVQEIAAASSEQATGVRQINIAMTQIGKVTEQTASSSEELAATSEQMAAQTHQLQDLMTFFVTDAGNGNSSGSGGARAALPAGYDRGAHRHNGGGNGRAQRPAPALVSASAGRSDAPDLDPTKFDRF